MAVHHIAADGASLGLFVRELGQPSLTIQPDREKIARITLDSFLCGFWKIYSQKFAGQIDPMPGAQSLFDFRQDRHPPSTPGCAG